MAVFVFSPCTCIPYILTFNNPLISLCFFACKYNTFYIQLLLPAGILPNRYNIPWLVRNLMAQPDFCCSTHCKWMKSKKSSLSCAYKTRSWTLMNLVGPFQLKIFCHSVILDKFLTLWC